MNAKFGHRWTKKHHFANSTKGLPQHVEGGPLTARQMFERDDLADHSKVDVEPETRSYARMNKSSVMDQPGGTARKWTQSLNLRKAITNQRGPLKGGKPGSTIFPSMDKSQNTAGGKVSTGKLKESMTLTEKAKWIKGAIKHPGRCKHMGSAACPAGSPQYNLAKTFKKHHGFHHEARPEEVVAALLED